MNEKKLRDNNIKLYPLDFTLEISQIEDNSAQCIIYDGFYDTPGFGAHFEKLLPKLHDTGTIYVFSAGRRHMMSIELGSNFLIANEMANVYHISIWHFGFSQVGRNHVDGFDYIYACHKDSCQPSIYSQLPCVIKDDFDTDKLSHSQFALYLMKPISLIAKLITSTTQPGDLVLDPCAGSGTTAIAALQTKRRFVGFESNSIHYATACQRLERYC